MKMNNWVPTSIAFVLLVFLAAGCRQEPETSAPAKGEGSGKYSVGLHLGERTETQATVQLQSREQRLSYAIGLLIGRDLDRQELDLNSELLARGFQDAYSGKTPALSDEEVEQVREEFRRQRGAK